MSSPQRENGFTAIANELLEQIILADLTGGEFRCLMFLIRCTYGHQKKQDRISLAQWAAGVGMKKQNVWAILQRLIARNFIAGTCDRPKSALTWRLNKDYDTWLPNSESVMPQHDSSVPSQHDSSKTSVMPQHDKSVIPPHERTKERKKAEAAAATAKSKCAVSQFAQAYQDILGKMIESRVRSEEIQDWEKRVPYPAWEYALREALNKGHRHDWKYTTRILERLEREGYQPQPASISTTTVNFALEELV